MGKITESVVHATKFDFNADRKLVCERAIYASTMASRRYLFVGEMHSKASDKKRTEAVAEACADNEDIIIIAERDILKDYPHLGLKKNVIHEADRKSSSAAPARNKNIVEQILAETAKEASMKRKHANPRMVLILFGQEHEPHIRKELEAQTGKDEKICWWSFPSPADALDQLKWATYKDQKGYTFQGFVPTLPDEESGKEMLAKGKYAGALTLDVLAAFNVAGNFKGQYYALYTEDKFKESAALAATLEKSGKGQLKASTATCARLVAIDKNEYDRLVKAASE